jgi:outer membrane protein OmpA-like peptidoglycan-associated protein
VSLRASTGLFQGDIHLQGPLIKVGAKQSEVCSDGRTYMRPSLKGLQTLCLTVGVVLAMLTGTATGDDCRRAPNILILFDASGFMKDRGRYEFFIKQMEFFQQAIPLTADGLFNVGVRHYGLKVGLGCQNTESIQAIGPWDPERFLYAFPKTLSYGTSSLSAGLRAAADDAAAAEGKTVIVVIGGGIESCKTDPVKTAERISINDPQLEIHTFQIGSDDEGTFNLRGIAEKCRGAYVNLNQFSSPAGWHAWMKRFLVVQCAASSPAPSTPAQASVGPIVFDPGSASLRSKDQAVNAANQANLNLIGDFLKKNLSARVILHGFAGEKGKAEYRQHLARKRAEAVAQLLTTGYGIPGTQMSIVSHGAAKPADPGTPQSDRTAGRRVEIEFAF